MSRINQVIFVVFMTAVVVCSGIFLYQASVASAKKAEMAKLGQQMSRYNPQVNQNMIIAAMAKASQERQTAKAYGSRYLGMAVIGEIADLTPRDISLMSITAGLAGPGTAGAQSTDKGQPQAPASGANSILIEGMIFGDRSALESILAGYVIKLDSSTMFQSVKVVKNEIDSFKKRQVLRFTVEAKTG